MRQNTGCICIRNTADSMTPLVPVHAYEAAVCYIIPREVPVVVLATFKAGTNKVGELVIGGKSRVTMKKNPAIGRRMCPACYSAGVRKYVPDKGPDRLTCDVHGKIDYFDSMVKPYFYYYTGVSNIKTAHVTFEDPWMKLADAMKAGLSGNIEKVDFNPKLVDGCIYCTGTLNRVITIDIAELRGQRYDFLA
jgi:hypothetical protein